MRKRQFPNRITGLLAGAMMTAGSALAAEDIFDTMISRTALDGGFPLFADGKAATIVLSEEDFPQVVRAAKDLSEDVKRVTGTASSVERDGKTAAVPTSTGSNTRKRNDLSIIFTLTQL